MIFDLTTMMQAARLAREESTQGRTIYIVVTEDGFIVQGNRGSASTAIDVGWPEMDANPGQLANAVRLVARRL